jgi:phosphatidylethanolamine-binding protein (PEBP) family uncharacterized protein
MERTTASTLHRIVSAIAGPLLGVALLVAYAGAANADTLTISSPAFGDGAPIPAQYSCKGANMAPPLAWSAPSGAALVVDDPDARGYVHWIVTGIAPGSGSTADGQTPAGGSVLPNSTGQSVYSGPCPPAGTGTHHYRFTLYQLPASFQLPGGLAGPQGAQTIARAATAQATLTGTFQG